MRLLRMGMVGGGPGAFIGPVHRMAAELDGRIRLTAGAFSSDPDRSRAAGVGYGIDPDRSYPNYEAMMASEAARSDGIDLVAIATPNHLHLPVARAALAAGLHVVSDKPATATLDEALALREAVRASDRIYALTYTYTGYPMLREARRRISAGAIGSIRKVMVDYPQGWLARPVEREGSKQAAWRTNASFAGVGGCIGDIGVHAFNLAEFVSGARVVEFVADLSSVVEGRSLDDDCNMLLRFDGGQTGVLTASQIAAGERNGLTIRVYGSDGGMRWSHEAPSQLTIERPDGPTETWHAGTTMESRLPSGHPEGFVAAFANIYRDVADTITSGGRLPAEVPGIDEGVRSMAFVEQAVAASRRRAGWTKLEVPA